MTSSTRLRNSGRKCCAQHREHLVAHSLVLRRVSGRRHLGDDVRAEVAGHDDHGVAEVHGAALAVGEAPVVEQLQQDVENVLVRFSISSRSSTL